MYSKEQIFENIKKHGKQPDTKKEKYIFNGIMIQKQNNIIQFYHAGGSLNLKDYGNFKIDNDYVIFAEKEMQYILKNGLFKGTNKIKEVRQSVKKRLVNMQIDIIDLINEKELELN